MIFNSADQDIITDQINQAIQEGLIKRNKGGEINQVVAKKYDKGKKTDKKCFNCNKVGHFANKCPERSNNNNNKNKNRNFKKTFRNKSSTGPKQSEGQAFLTYEDSDSEYQYENNSYAMSCYVTVEKDSEEAQDEPEEEKIKIKEETPEFILEDPSLNKRNFSEESEEDKFFLQHQTIETNKRLKTTNEDESDDDGYDPAHPFSKVNRTQSAEIYSVTNEGYVNYFVVDTGASHHVINDQTYFSNIENTSMTINTINSKEYIHHKGQAHAGNVVLNDALLVPANGFRDESSLWLIEPVESYIYKIDTYDEIMSQHKKLGHVSLNQLYSILGGRYSHQNIKQVLRLCETCASNRR
ncbi:hypothetical protein CANARDRAFT_28126 [[Candida] arabinofermentans NRRL YB-2248]|uniref:CCHC-type domain-containing protein n=1 Tax=[Candida] arabinofermentans NRRL YB-2248 TaxID=983967 RepID=A0A1E4T2V3_9ASCO|nr:hypothetical protein CANARDRAFT_28126 [[Candida] arabinofermentans NRRL YB-2248]